MIAIDGRGEHVIMTAGASAQDALCRAVEQGILQGRSGNLAASGDTATRAEVSAIMMRFLKAWRTEEALQKKRRTL